MSEPREFPIQQGIPIPWDAAEQAYRTYAKLYGRQQSLERLAERGGFGLAEWACLYLGHERQCRYTDACVQRALAAVAAGGQPPSDGMPSEAKREDLECWLLEELERGKIPGESEGIIVSPDQARMVLFLLAYAAERGVSGA